MQDAGPDPGRQVSWSSSHESYYIGRLLASAGLSLLTPLPKPRHQAHCLPSSSLGLVYLLKPLIKALQLVHGIDVMGTDI